MLKAIILSSKSDPGALIDILEEGKLFDVESAADPDAVLADAEASFDYDLFVIDGCAPDLNAESRRNFEHSLGSGAGLLFVRAAASPHPWPLIDKLAVWLTPATSPASAPERLNVRYLDHQHPVTRGLRDFEIVDSVPAGGMACDDDVHRILAASSPIESAAEDPAFIPAMISTHHGRGRVFHCVLTPAAGGEPLRRAIGRAAEWAATGNVIDF